ncbi:MAG: serine hydrolase [Solirubrobacterales bacterium]
MGTLGNLWARAAAAALTALVLGAAVAEARSWPPSPYPEAGRLAAARELAAAAPGTVSFAVIDADGGLRGYEPDDQFSSASVSKALLLAAELRRLRAGGEPLDGGTRSLLEAMITVSDNDAASAVYARVGDEGMSEAAERAGMRSFEVTPGYWGGAQVTAADLARFFFRLDRNLAGPHRRYAERLLSGVVSTQRWGIPAAAPGRWTVYFKGGWRPPATEETSGPVTHQAALLRDRTGERLGLAILTDLAPGSTAYAVLAGITERLLARPPRESRWPAP